VEDELTDMTELPIDFHSFLREREREREILKYVYESVIKIWGQIINYSTLLFSNS
jgi:hypothetical protein